MIEIEGLRATGLHIDRFTLRAGEAWCCLGGTGSGMERFSAVLGGTETACTARRLELPRNIGVISFRGQQELYEAELRRDDTDFLDRLDPGTPARAFLTRVEEHRPLIDLFRLGPHLAVCRALACQVLQQTVFPLFCGLALGRGENTKTPKISVLRLLAPESPTAC